VPSGSASQVLASIETPVETVSDNAATATEAHMAVAPPDEQWSAEDLAQSDNDHHVSSQESRISMAAGY
jgi:hypothetical protein